MSEKRVDMNGPLGDGEWIRPYRTNLYPPSDREDAAAIQSPPMSIAQIAIVGCPNVGKSSLLNRLVRRRISIVDPSEAYEQIVMVRAHRGRFEGPRSRFVRDERRSSHPALGVVGLRSNEDFAADPVSAAGITDVDELHVSRGTPRRRSALPARSSPCRAPTAAGRWDRPDSAYRNRARVLGVVAQAASA